MPPIRLLITLQAALIGAALAGCQSMTDSPPPTQAETSIDPMLKSEIDHVIDDAAARGFAGQVAVMRDDGPVYPRAAGSADLAGDVPVTEQTLYHVASLTKYFTAVIILKAVEEGKLSLDAPAAELFPGTALQSRDFTVADLLAHRSGLKSTYAAESEAMQDGAIAAIAKANPEEPFPSAASGEARSERPFKYSNDGYDLLAIILERIYGKPYETVFREKIAAPAQIQHFGFWGEAALSDPRVRGQPLEPASEQLSRRNYGMIGSAGLLISANDLVRFENALNEGRILSRASLSELRAPRAKASIGEVLYGSFLVDTALGKAISARGAEDWGDNAYLNDYRDCGSIVAIVTSRGPAEGSGEPLWRDQFIGKVEGALKRMCAKSPG